MRRLEFALAAALAALIPATETLGQEREYRVEGTIVDSSQQAIAGATIELRERTTRRAFKMKSDQTGAFKMVGLSHGIYEVRITKPGYQARTDEWDLSEAQGTMKRVDYNPYVMLSDQQVAELDRTARQQKLFEEATELVRKGETGAALPALEKLLAAQPDDANALFLLALCRLQSGQPALAADELRRVIELTPGFAPAHVNLAICYEQLGDPERALATYDAALALDPASPIALYNAGVLRYNAKDAARALPYFEKILLTTPDDDRALEMAGYCELQNAAYAKALAHLERARPLIGDPARAAAIDEIIKELRPRVQAGPANRGGA